MMPVVPQFGPWSSATLRTARSFPSHRLL